MDEKRVKSPGELLRMLEAYVIRVKDTKGTDQYFMMSPTLHNEIAWGLHNLQHKLDMQERERKIANGQSESAGDSAG